VVLEMGTSGRGEIAKLVEIAAPTIAVVTGTGRAHLEGLVDETAVAAEKATILDGAALGLVNVDRPAIESELEPRRRRGDRIVTYGTVDHADRRLLDRTPLPGGGQSIKLEGMACELALDGGHNAVNAIAAIEVARHLGVPDDRIAAALGSVEPPAMRFVRRDLGGVVVIDDAYNANPESVKASLGAFAEITRASDHAPPRRVAILGAMLELGERSEDLHVEVGECAGRTDLTHLIVVRTHGGDVLARSAADAGFSGGILLVEDAAEAGRRAVELVEPGDMVLVKGSRGIGLEVVVEALTRSLENNG
jgi:UDP-N-acetylmuramoyl-tripeptide--D-alanyl-D-alanine ligase